METFLASPIFRYALFPVGSAILGVAVKCVTRNDRYASFRKEDMAVGLELMLTACLLFVVLTTDRALALLQANRQLARVLATTPIDSTNAAALQAQVQLLSGRLALAGWMIALLFLGLWSVSTLVRKWGWKSETEMTPLIGIAIPLGFGILALIAVMGGAVQ
ncbi:MAG: hypothetical protein QOH41_423 [Blastocatellia bacterium]|jgi:hypothetical protein|nr:hypothetical protein [Blastocatellia bacterium]